MNKPESYRIFLRCAAVLLLGGSLYWYGTHLFTYLINAPDSDDFVDVLWFFEIFLSAETLGQKFYALFLPIHEHITIMNHLMYLLDYSVFGQVDLRHYVLIGNVFIVALALLLGWQLGRYCGRLVGICIALSVYLTVWHWHSSFWAMTSISNHVVILFALMAALAMQYWPQRWWLAYLLALLATASQANGLAVFIAIAVTHAASAWQQGRALPWRDILVPLVVMACVLWLYINHQNPFQSHHHLDHQALFTEPDLIHLYQRDISGTDTKEFSLMNVLLAFFLFSGATIFNPDFVGVLLGFVLGFCILTLFLIRAWNKKLDRFTCMFLMFLLISIVLMSVGRVSMLGPDAVFQPRYKMYSLLLLLLALYVLLQQSRHPQRWAAGALLLALTVQWTSTAALPGMAANRKTLTDSYYHWYIDGGLGRSTMVFYPTNQDRRLFTAYRMGFYDPYGAIDLRHKPLQVESLSFESVSAESACQKNTAQTASVNVQVYSKKKRALGVEITLPRDEQRLSGLELLWFCGETSAVQLQLAERNQTASGGFWPLVVPKTQLPAGEYQLVLQAGQSLFSAGMVSFK